MAHYLSLSHKQARFLELAAKRIPSNMSQSGENKIMAPKFIPPVSTSNSSHYINLLKGLQRSLIYKYSVATWTFCVHFTVFSLCAKTVKPILCYGKVPHLSAKFIYKLINLPAEMRKNLICFFEADDEVRLRSFPLSFTYKPMLFASLSSDWTTTTGRLLYPATCLPRKDGDTR